MYYQAVITRDDDALVVEFPDLPGCVTQVEPGEEFDPIAGDVLALYLGDSLAHGEAPPAPGHSVIPPGAELRPVRVPAVLAARVQLRQAREAAGLSQSGLASRLGVTLPEIVQLESPDAPFDLEAFERAAAGLDLTLDLALVRRAA